MDRVNNILKNGTSKYFFINKDNQWEIKHPPLFKGMLIKDLYEKEGHKIIEMLERMMEEDISYKDKINIKQILNEINRTNER